MLSLKIKKKEKLFLLIKKKIKNIELVGWSASSGIKAEEGRETMHNNTEVTYPECWVIALSLFPWAGEQNQQKDLYTEFSSSQDSSAKVLLTETLHYRWYRTPFSYSYVDVA